MRSGIIIYIVSLVCFFTSNSTLAANTSCSHNFGFSDNINVDSVVTKAISLIKDGDTDNGLRYLFQAKTIYETNPDLIANPDDYAKTLNAIGYVYFYKRNNIQEAYSYYLKGLKAIESNPETQAAAYLNVNLANIYLVLRDEERAAQMFKAAFNSAFIRKDYEIMQIAYVNLLWLAIELDKKSLVEAELTKFKSLKLPDSDMLIYANAIEQVARSVFSGHLQEAAILADVQKKAAEKLQDGNRYIAASMQIASSIMQKEGNNAGAINALQELRTFSVSHNMPDWELSACKELYDILNNHNQHHEALEMKERYLALTDSLLNAEIVGRLKDMEYEGKIDSYKTEILQKEITSHWQRTIIYILGISLLIIIILVIYSRLQRLRANDFAATIFRNSRNQLQDKLIVSKPPSEQRITEEQKSLAARIAELFENSTEIFSPDFSVATLASIIGSSPKYVSAAINAAFNKNFNALLSQFRIREACRKLSDNDNYGHLTLEAIGNSVGFLSRNHFTKVFKEITGLTPSQYRKMSFDDPNIKE